MGATPATPAECKVLQILETLATDIGGRISV